MEDGDNTEHDGNTEPGENTEHEENTEQEILEPSTEHVLYETISAECEIRGTLSGSNYGSLNVESMQSTTSTTYDQVNPETMIPPEI